MRKTATIFTLLIVAAFAGVMIIRVNQRDREETGGDTHVVPVVAEGEMTNRDMLFSVPDDVTLIAEDVEYAPGVTGFHAVPADGEDLPGVIMIHEWWGLNDNIRDMARTLAANGYDVLAVDLFGTVATTSEEARAQTASLDQDAALENMRAAATYLRERGAERLATYGWCFGGGQSLQFSLAEPVDATIIYYGRLESDTEVLRNLEGPVLGAFGEDDGSITPADVEAFRKGLNEIGLENDIEIYPGVGHAFANPSGPNFAPGPTTDAWERTVEFLDRTLRQ